MALRGEHKVRPTYSLREHLEGGRRELRRCSHEILGRDCVQKTVPVPPNGAVALSEPRILEELAHARITPVREAQFDPEREHHITFVMPWYPGGSLADALADGHHFSLLEAITLIRHVLEALAYVHVTHEMIHRDVKPGNILLDERRREAFLGDFGCAAQLDGDGRATFERTTLQYMAPECAPENAMTIRSDLYAVGLVLFEVVNGRLRWEDIDQAKVERRLTKAQRAMADRIVAPSAFAPHVPPSLVAVTRRAIARDPSRRFASASEFLAALQRVQAVDWRVDNRDGLEGRWIGTWPPHLQINRRALCVVDSRVLRSGERRGELRLTGTYQRTKDSRARRCIADVTVAPDDREAVRQFFEDVALSAAQRVAAR